MDLTENFTKEEFDCHDGSEMPDDVLENIKLLAIELQKIRDFIGCPIKVNSGYRSPEHNKKIGGKQEVPGIPNSGSQHLYGKAADIYVKELSIGYLHEIIEQLISENILNIKGLGKYTNFLHLDIRDKKARWGY